MRGPAEFATLGHVSDASHKPWAVPTRPPTVAVGASSHSRLVQAQDRNRSPRWRGIGWRVAAILSVVGAAVALLLATGVGTAQARVDPLSEQERIDLGARARVSTVRVAARSCPGSVRGSGFVVGGLLFTSGHLVVFDDRLKVDRPGQPVESPVVAASTTIDIAVANGSALVALDLNLSRTAPPAGERIFLAGFPGGGPLEVAEATLEGYGNATDWGVLGERVMLIERGIRPGFSGGPVFNRDGDVVGMLAGVDVVTGLTVAIPADELARTVELAVETWGTGVGSVAHAARPCEG
ncbi:MAG: trypsin-like peptidase domain-containing protein [Acidimicrobiales bacterium]|nr:trypsin-like peptidase domain-containing protein [Acidimicrobiales bacterium]